jgi:hypothetical protein
MEYKHFWLEPATCKPYRTSCLCLNLKFSFLSGNSSGSPEWLLGNHEG